MNFKRRFWNGLESDYFDNFWMKGVSWKIIGFIRVEAAKIWTNFIGAWKFFDTSFSFKLDQAQPSILVLAISVPIYLCPFKKTGKPYKLKGFQLKILFFIKLVKKRKVIRKIIHSLRNYQYSRLMCLKSLKIMAVFDIVRACFDWWNIFRYF